MANLPPNVRRFWNKIPRSEKRRVIDAAPDKPELTPWELARHITDSHGALISGSSVYRIPWGYDLAASPAYIVLSAAGEFRHETKRAHESLYNLTPADVYHGRDRTIKVARNLVKEPTLRRRRRLNMGLERLGEAIARPEKLRQAVHWKPARTVPKALTKRSYSGHPQRQLRNPKTN